METAAELVKAGRRYRQLTQKELAGISGVPPSTVLRIESGLVDPAYGTVVKLMCTMGLRPEPGLFEESTDGQIERASLAEPRLEERFDMYRVAAQVSPVAGRIGARTVTADLDEMTDVLERTGVSYAYSALEGFYGGWPEHGTVYVLPMTDAASRFIELVNGIMVMSPDWSIIDTIASPNRQADVGLELLAAIDDADRRSAA